MTTASEHSAFAKNYLRGIADLLEKVDCDALGRALDVMHAAKKHDHHVFLAGNGGSAATASHMANDLMKPTTDGEYPGLRAISLSDNTQLVTAVANDIGYDQVFTRQLRRLGRAKDVLIVISASGNSPNVLHVLEAAKDMGLTSIGFLGKNGGKAKSMVDVAIVVPHDEYGPIEDVHLIFNHCIAASLSGRNA